MAKKKPDDEVEITYVRPSHLFPENWQGGALRKMSTFIRDSPVGCGCRSFLLMEDEDREIVFFYWPTLEAFSAGDAKVNWRKVQWEDIDAPDLLARIIRIKKVMDDNGVSISRAIVLYVIEQLQEMIDGHTETRDPGSRGSNPYSGNAGRLGDDDGGDAGRSTGEDGELDRGAAVQGDPDQREDGYLGGPGADGVLGGDPDGDGGRGGADPAAGYIDPAIVAKIRTRHRARRAVEG